MREVIPVMVLLEDLKATLPIDVELPNIHCIMFEDNKYCIELVQCPKMRPRTKRIVLKYHRFRSKVKDGMINAEYINIKDQVADIYTKVLPEVQFKYLRKLLSGW